MQPTRLTSEHINTLIEQQLEAWPEARENFSRIKDTSRRVFRLGALNCGAQLNPARIKSTGASIDSKSIEARPCFLCKSNRPRQQITVEWMPGWHLLVNPYPILPVHFTVAATDHKPQDRIPLDMAAMAEAAPDLVFFFNGARAGASAPDHMHVQAVLKSELPLMRIVERYHPASHSGFMSSEQYGVDLPFHFVSAVVTPDAGGMKALALIPGSFGIDATTGEPDRGLVNAFFWIGDNGLLRIAIVPRRAHRPACYDAGESDRLIISPGAIDMTGIIVTPRPQDFLRLSAEKIGQIYSEVAFSDALPGAIRDYFNV